MLSQLLEHVINTKSSDLHLSSNHVPMVRTDGELEPVPGAAVLGAKELTDILSALMTKGQFATFEKKLEIDFSIKGLNDTRFRVNAFKNIYGPAATFRLIPARSMSLDEMGAPKVLRDLCKLSKGLVLVVGQTGSGKSTTLAAMIEHINATSKSHIITIEDPIEFVYKSGISLINQREVGVDTFSFPIALRSALREDPDVIMVGEMRDLETISLALTAAETGHLVLATLHTSSAAQSINRIIDVFPFQDKGLVRSMLSSSLQAIISQRLIKKNGGGRVAAYEIMLSNNSIRNLIREDKVPQIASIIEISKKYGMITMKDSVIDLANRQIITRASAEELLASFGQSD